MSRVTVVDSHLLRFALRRLLRVFCPPPQLYIYIYITYI